MTDYIALVGCEEDDGQRFEIGDTVPGNYFSRKTVKHWLKKGVLAEIVDVEDELIEAAEAADEEDE